MPQLRNYAVAVLAYSGGGGNHSFHELAIVLRAALGWVSDGGEGAPFPAPVM
jgi:hypothetical protein